MKFSLIMCTLNRVNEVSEFLKSISEQTYKNFELIILDQNQDDRLEEIICKYKDKIDLKYFKSLEPGLSKNRNIGLKYVTGDIIAFPDDDCVYPRHTLERIMEVFKNGDVDSISIKFTKLVNKGQDQLEINDFSYSAIKNARLVNKFNCLRKTCSITIFINKEVIDVIGGFNESIGLGGKVIEAGEDYDYAFKILKSGFKMLDIPQIAVLHPILEINMLDKHQFNRNKKRAELTAKVIMFMANYHKLGLDFKIYRLIDRLLGFVYRAIKLDVKGCKLVSCDIRTTIKYWSIS